MSERSPRRPGPSLRLVGLGALVAAFAAVLALTDIASLDYWWHLRLGRWIAEHGRVPRTDPFSFTAAGARYLDVHWLHQLVLWGAYRLGGHAAVVLWQGVLAVVLAGLLAANAGWRRPEWTALGVGLALWLASGRFLPRPELPTFVLLAAVLWLLESDRARGGSRRLWAILPLQLVWANVHGLYVLGVFACGAHLAGALLAPLAGEAFDARRAVRLAALTVGSVAVALVNPNGADLLLYPLLQLGMISDVSGLHAPWVVELGRLLGGNADPAARALTLGLAAATLAALVADRRRLPASDVLLFGGFLYLALGAHRNLALFAIVAAPMAVRHLGAWLDARREPAWLAPVATALAAGLLLAGVADGARGRLHGRLSDPRRPGLGIAEGLQPVAAVDWIERARPPGRIFHAMGDGGYLIWRLHPDYPVMLDGRLEVYGREAFLRLNTGAPDAFARIAEELGIGTALLSYRTQPFDELLRALYLDPGWTLAFVDDVAAVFVRAGAGFAPVDVAAPDLFGPLPDEAPDRLRPRVLARVRFELAVGRPADGLERWRAFRLRHPGQPDEPLLHAALLLGAGRAAEADALLQAATDASDDPQLLEDVASVRAQAGDAAGAAALAARAAALDPARERSGGRPTPRAVATIRARHDRARLRVALEDGAVIAGTLLLLVVSLRARRRPG